MFRSSQVRDATYWNTMAKTSRSRRDSLSGFISYYVSARQQTNSSETRVNHVGKEGQKDPDSHRNDGRDRQRAIEIHHGKEESEDIVSTRSKGRKRNPLHRTQDVFLLLIVDPTDADPLQNVNNHQTERNVQIAHDLRGNCSFHYKYRNEAHRR